MNRLRSFCSSTLGRKILMALSGAFLVLFVVGHMVGNLKIFLGKDAAGVYAIDHYAHYLREIGQDLLGPTTFLWTFRVMLILAVFVHVSCALSLYLLNRRVRPVGYVKQEFRSANWASRTMAIGGSVIIFFIFFHILHFTTGHLHFSGFVEGMVYHNVTYAFQSLPLVLFYLVAMLALALHVYHGSWSMFQTLGITTPSLNPILVLVAKGLSLLLLLGFSAVPVAVYLGVLPVP